MVTLKIVCCLWADSTSYGRWRPRTSINTLKPMMCKSVGYLVHEDKKHLVIAQSCSADDEVLDLIVIPKACIKKVRKIKQPAL